MRRKTKFIVGWGIIGGVISAFADTFDQMFTHKNNGIDFNLKSFDINRTIRKSIVGSTIGAAIGYGVYQYKLKKEANLPYNSNEYLKKVLNQENINSDPNLLINVLNIRNEILEWLTDIYYSKLVEVPQNIGSFNRRTAILSDFDIDIVLPFKKNAFNTLEEMFNDVLETIKSNYGSTASVSRFKKAIGLAFEIDGNDIFIDIVPGREINDYKIDRNLQLYVNSNWVWEKSSFFKTNISLQKNLTKNKAEARQVIKLLKIYRNKTGLEISSIIIEQCVIQALSINKYGINSSLTENLLNCMEYLSKILKLNSYFDLSNSNNNLNSKTSTQKRHSDSEQIKIDIIQIRENDRYLKEIFESDN